MLYNLHAYKLSVLSDTWKHADSHCNARAWHHGQAAPESSTQMVRCKAHWLWLGGRLSADGPSASLTAGCAALQSNPEPAVLAGAVGAAGVGWGDQAAPACPLAAGVLVQAAGAAPCRPPGLHSRRVVRRAARCAQHAPLPGGVCQDNASYLQDGCSLDVTTLSPVCRCDQAGSCSCSCRPWPRTLSHAAVGSISHVPTGGMPVTGVAGSVLGGGDTSFWSCAGSSCLSSGSPKGSGAGGWGGPLPPSTPA